MLWSVPDMYCFVPTTSGPMFLYYLAWTHKSAMTAEIIGWLIEVMTERCQNTHSAAQLAGHGTAYLQTRQNAHTDSSPPEKHV